MNKPDNAEKSWEEERKVFFQLASEAEMVDDLAQFAKAFGRFQAASIELADGRSASYQIPSNVRMMPVENQIERASTGDLKVASSQSTRSSNPSYYARFRKK